MVLSIGEILIDEFNSNGQVNKKAGGAPFNVAMNIARFNGDSAFFGVVGNDEDGRFLTNAAIERLKNKAFIQVSKYKTTKAIVTLTNGERSFRFERDNGSDYHFDLDFLKKIDLSNVSIVHFGSLMISFNEGLEFLNKAIDYIKQNSSALISFDINYRSDIFDNQNDSIILLSEIIKKVDLLKISDDELKLFTNESNLLKAINNIVFKDTRCFISLGKDGSAYYHNGNIIEVPTIKVKPVDTTGAGDAFYSYVLYSIDKHGLDENHAYIKDMLYTANIVGALTTLGKGAIEPVPTLNEVAKHKGA